MCVVISVHIWFIFHFQFCRFVAGYFWVFRCNSLIINAIHFSGMHAFAGWVCLSVPLIHLIDLIFRVWVVWMRMYLWLFLFILGLLFISSFAGFLPVNFVFLGVTH